MKNRINVLAIVLIAGIATSFMINGRSTPNAGLEKGLSVSTKYSPKWEGLRFSNKGISINKFLSDIILNVTGYPDKTSKGFSNFLQYMFPYPFITDFFNEAISINAP